MDIHVLGCSGGIGRGLRTTALRVDSDVLVDCGTGVGDLSLDELREIRHVFLTHSHLDHIVSLPLLIDTIYEDLVKNPLTLHCQPETFAVLKEHIFNWKVWPNFFKLPSRENPVIKFSPFSPGEEIEIEGRSFQMIEVQHTVPAVAYFVKSATGSFAFTGDTAAAPKLWHALNQDEGVDLVIVECAFANQRSDIADKAKHFSPQTLAEALNELTHDAQICISHMQPGDESRIMDQLLKEMPARNIRSIKSGDVLSI